MGVVAIFMLTALWTGCAEGAHKPTVVSLDFCADQVVLALADDEQILALSADAKKVFSFFRERAKQFHSHSNELDELLLLDPDLVFTSGSGSSIAARVLNHHGARVYSFDSSSVSNLSVTNLLKAGTVLGDPQKAELLSQSAKSLLRTLQSGTARPVPGLYLSPSGITSGAGTFIDQILNLGGVDNVVARHGIEGWSQLDLEILVVEQPQVIVTSFFDNKVAHQDSWRFAAHPAVQKLLKKALVVDVPSRLLSCSEWFALEGAAYIHDHINNGRLNRK